MIDINKKLLKSEQVLFECKNVTDRRFFNHPSGKNLFFKFLRSTASDRKYYFELLRSF